MLQKKLKLGAFVLLISSLTCLATAGTLANLARLSRWIRLHYTAALQSKEALTYTGPISSTPAGQVAIGLSVQSVGNNAPQFILLLGNVRIKGKITPTTTGATLPTQLRLTYSHNSPKGKTLNSESFTVRVQSDGLIPVQNFRFTQFDVYSPNEVLQETVSAVDTPMPAGTLKLLVRHTIGNARSASSADADLTDSETATPPQLIYAYTHFIEDRKANEAFGPFILKALGQPGFTLSGTARISGKLINDDTGVPFPGTVNVSVDHVNAKTKALISSDNFNITLNPDGTIPAQSFPFTTINQLGLPEAIKGTFKANHAFPFSTIQVKMTFTPSTARLSQSNRAKGSGL